jgi:DNA-binding CsgD family transcriptional regulator
VSLSQREREVLALLARGMTVREAARQLGLAEHTVAGYIKIVYQKLNISTRAQAALEAAKRKLI